MISEQLIKKVLLNIFNIQKEETFLMVTDSGFIEYAKDFVRVAKTLCKRANLLEIPIGERNGAEPSKDAAQKMLEYDVEMFWTSTSLSHTTARRNASATGARIISSPGMTVEMFERCVDIDYEELLEVHKELQPIIANSKLIHVTSEKGTDITFSVHDTHGKPEKVIKHNKGAFGNLPGDEVDSGIIRETMNGQIVFDGSFPGIGKLSEEIVVIVKEGFGVIVSENESSTKLQEMLEGVGSDAFKVAEFGVGTNPKAQLTGVVLEDEKIRGTIHFAFGNDLTYNGDNDVAIHVDGIVCKPTVVIDSVKIHEDGTLLLKSCKY